MAAEVMLPLVRQYLTPDAPNPEGRRAVVEYYHGGLRHFFVTADPGEVDALVFDAYGTLFDVHSVTALAE